MRRSQEPAKQRQMTSRRRMRSSWTNSTLTIIGRVRPTLRRCRRTLRRRERAIDTDRNLSFVAKVGKAFEAVHAHNHRHPQQDDLPSDDAEEDFVDGTVTTAKRSKEQMVVEPVALLGRERFQSWAFVSTPDGAIASLIA